MAENTEFKDALAVEEAAQPARKVGGVPYQVVPDGYRLESLEKHLPAPARKAGETAVLDVESFARLWKEHAKTGSIIHADPFETKIIGVFNPHTRNEPGWRDHLVRLDVTGTNQWKAWSAAATKRFDQADFADFLTENLPDIYNPPGADVLEVVQNLKATKKVAFESGTHLPTGATDFVYREEIQHGGGAKGQFKVPEELTLFIPVLRGQPAQEVTVRLFWRIGDDKRLSFSLKIHQRDRILEGAFEAVLAAVEEATSEKPLLAYFD